MRDTALKNAHHLLHDVMKAVDSNRDGKIQYEGMRSITMPACRSRIALEI
jgi:hypothetical protein